MNRPGKHRPATLRAGIEWLQAKFDSASPPALFAGYLLFSVLMVIATSACGLGQFPVQVHEGQTRTKGFFWELNWGLNHLLFIPVGLFCCSLVNREISRQLGRISGAHMAVDGAFKEMPLADIQKDWEDIRPGPVWFCVIVAIAMIASWVEWWAGSLGQALGFIPQEPLENIGWTNAAVVDPNISKVANVFLSFLAFTAQGFDVGFFCYTVSIVLAFAIWIYRYDDTSERKIIPNVASADVRRGFEVFEPLMLRLLCMALAFTFVLFLIRMQIIYNSSPSPTSTALEFVLKDVVAGFFVDMKAVFLGQQNELFEISLAPVYGMVIACVAMVVIVSLVTVFPTLILFFLAQGSRDALKTCLEQPKCPPCTARGMVKADCAERLKNIDFWPMRYPRPIELLAYIVFAAFCFIFYKFTVALLGVLVMRLVYMVYKVITQSVPAPNAQPAAQ
jgi:hypothetical protein